MSDPIEDRLEATVGRIHAVRRDGDSIRIDFNVGYEFDPDDAGGVLEVACLRCQSAETALKTWQSKVGEEYEFVRLGSTNGRRTLEVQLMWVPDRLELVADDVGATERPYNVADLRQAHEGEERHWKSIAQDWVELRNRLQSVQAFVREEIRRLERKASFLRRTRPSRSAELTRARELLRRVEKKLSVPDS